MPEVIVERPEAGIAIIRLNRPEARNALDMPTRRQIADAFTELTDDSTVRAIILTGGDKIFAAGADIREMAELGPVQVMGRATQRYYVPVVNCPKPIIAAVCGFALGGGCELAMHADIIIAGRAAVFGQPEVKVGVLPGSGGTQRLIRAVGKYKALKILMLGEPMGAEEAERIGLVTEVVPDADVLKRAMEIAQKLRDLPPLALAQIKEVTLAGADAPLQAGLAMEQRANQLLFATADQKEGMRAFIEKRKPIFKGA